ncbi:hypothetical protein, conserved [Trypanosoma cruzi]|uniref:Uncharacterized protein n=1 Tax=Trypanosoma cruzi (strain CL Brener) TaxID=353153 RepID=Q4DWG5_TRYCC|nr:hypothetical protein, conserved [Trypanosoma cruzi]EAN96885.1 hypothetical protein, conserved [Trypanosoma cruzi]|eukprot:XP_818736.1 hypothetical protein [Trypanosoma cruzi strain CL Brener]
MKEDSSPDSSTDAIAEARRLPLPLPPLEEKPDALVLHHEASKLSNEIYFSAPVAPLGMDETENTSVSFSGKLGINMAEANSEKAMHDEAKLWGDDKPLKLPEISTATGKSEVDSDAELPSRHRPKSWKEDEVTTQAALASQLHRATFIPLVNTPHPLDTHSKACQSGRNVRPRPGVLDMSLLTIDDPHEEPLGSETEFYSGATWLALTILGMSPLHPNTSIVHPFVRIWLVNGVTGSNLVQIGGGVAPFVLTHPIDLRLRGTRAPWWGARFNLRVQSNIVHDVSSNAVLLLEVLEMGTENICGFPLRRDGLYPICWGFLRLHDAHGRLNTRNRLHVQMFPFPQRASYLTKLMQLFPSFCFPSSFSFSADAIRTVAADGSPASPNSYHGVPDKTENFSFKTSTPPDIFFVYRDPRNRKVPYSAGMLISLEVNKDAHHPGETAIFPYEEYLLNQMSVPNEFLPKSIVHSLSPFSHPMRRVRDVSLSLVNTAALLKSYLREKEERVLPPIDVLQRVQLRGRVSCVAFSGGTVWLAMGVTASMEHVVQLRHVLMPEIPVIREFRGHVGHIHHLVFRNDDKLLLSCSSDKTVRVWRCDFLSSPMDASRDLQSSCICTLPHTFPVYDGIFYQSHIITCGYDPHLFLWRYDKEHPSSLEEMRLDSMLLRSTCDSRGNFLGSSIFMTDLAFSPGGESFLGELLCKTPCEEEAIIYSVCASQLHRVWSVDAFGNLLVWRVLYEEAKDGKRIWKMSLRRRFKCHGATRVESHGGRVLVKCDKLPVAYLFDDSSQQLLHKISFHQRPYVPAVTLLPDGEAVVAGTNNGRLLCWECSSGILCTPGNGYGKAQVNFSIGSIAWSGAQQLCVVLGTEVGIGHVSHGTETTMTLGAVIGTPRTMESVILCKDSSASELFRARFAGELPTQQRNRAFSRSTSVAVNFATDRNTRFYTVSRAPDKNVSGDKETRIRQIISMWRGFVGQHNHTKQEAVGEAQSDPTAVYIIEDK